MCLFIKVTDQCFVKEIWKKSWELRVAELSDDEAEVTLSTGSQSSQRNSIVVLSAWYQFSLIKTWFELGKRNKIVVLLCKHRLRFVVFWKLFGSLSFYDQNWLTAIIKQWFLLLPVITKRYVRESIKQCRNASESVDSDVSVSFWTCFVTRHEIRSLSSFLIRQSQF